MNNIFYDIINLHNGEEDKKKVLENVTSSISFRGSNLWILACAIVIASVGLNVNSTAVIIGAMLISPLMSPIVGAGFGLAIFDFDLLRKSLKNLLIATIVSLIVATIYFYLSPFKDAQSEILSRTSPNIYDILIAFFGGLVGVIAITRVEKGNPIPGVAIATALMPPLCTAGYKFFLGALFLYLINCVFICISTFFIVKYLNYPPKEHVNVIYQKKIKLIVSVITALMIIPSIYLAYDLYKEKQTTVQINSFIENEFTKKNLTIIYKKIDFNTNPKKIELAFLSKKFENKSIDSLNQKLKNYNIKNASLIIRQDTKDLKSEILNEIHYQNKSLSEKDMLIKNLQEELLKYTFQNSSILKELNILYPELTKTSIGRQTDQNGNNKIFISYSSKTDIDKEKKEKIKKWLQERLNDNTVEILYNN
jgi:uncharacterized hydrophobic protein (TIGR00271 family)